MRLKVFMLSIALVAAGVWNAASSSAQEPPAPSAGTELVGGLLQPRGIAKGPDGMLYVAEAGTGGDTEFDAGDGIVTKNGNTGRVSKINPATGVRTTVVDGVPSSAFPETGEAIGVADVAFVGSQLYFLFTHGGEEWGFPEISTGIYRVKNDGTYELAADIGAFNKANPVEAITSGVQEDVEIGGNPYSMIVRNGTFYVSDGNHNRLMRVTTGGSVEEIVEFPNHPVSTGVATTSNGPFYVALLGRGPFLAEDGKIVSVGATTGTITEVASGVAMLTGVEVGPGGQLYALSFNDPAAAGEAFFAPGTGSLQKVNSDGTMAPHVTGLSFATDMLFDGNTLYILNFGVAPIGSVIEVENFSSVTPPVASPTAAPTQPGVAPTPTRPSGVVAPDTGNGGFGGGNGDGGAASTTMIALLLVAGVATLGTAAVVKRR